MSRPQIQQYQPGPQTQGVVVNGGLIDFQDNMQRGVPDYTIITPSLLAAQQQQQQQTPASALALLQQQQAASSHGFVQGLPSHQASPVGVPPNWICGPASYYHVNGVTYAPVASGDKGPPNAVVQSASAPAVVQPVPATPVAASSDDIVDEDPRKRVRRQVQAYMANKRNAAEGHRATSAPAGSSGKPPLPSSAGGVAQSGGGARSRHQKGQPSPEEAAAMRVNSLNASMPIVTNTNGHIRRKW
jgi:hypothetical protein